MVFCYLNSQKSINQSSISFMGDTQSTKAMSFLLPPGCRFYPSDEQLLCYYLTNKNTPSTTDVDGDGDGTLDCYDLIKELDVYDYDPCELPDCACYSYGYRGKRRHWYCYTVRVLKESGGRRRAKGGYWRRRGRVRDVLGRGGKVVGTRTSFVFYRGNSPKSAVRTDWVMYEYTLVGHLKASFVLCRVLVKSHGGNSVLENVLSSCAEESVSALRHIGIQCDGVQPEIVEASVLDDNSGDRNNGIIIYPTRPFLPDDRVTTGPVASFQFPLGIQPSEPVRIPGLTSSGMSVDDDTDQQILSISEEDFIELDDLV